MAAALAASAPGQHFIRSAYGATAMLGLSDPFVQPKFAYPVPDAMAPGFKYITNAMGEYKVKMREAMHMTGLVDPATNQLLTTPVWGYEDGNLKPSTPTWPGKTFEVKSASAVGGQPTTKVSWYNKLKRKNASHLLPVDTTMHWCYSLENYKNYSIANDGVPLITHLHGGHTDYPFDGNPEYFHSPGEKITGPQWNDVAGGFTNDFIYDNDVPAGNLWYHDHALGLTRLNVYAGLAGFYFVRDDEDTGQPGNPLGLPAWPYEKAYAIQDRMFRDTGELFYPAFPGEPFYDDFILDEMGNNILDAFPDQFPGGGPTALAEFFGDHMVVNGVIWPYENVEPRNYRLHLLNGTDSRFMVLQLKVVDAGVKDPNDPSASEPIPFQVIGSDQGLAPAAVENVTKLVFEPGSRYDIVVDFSQVRPGSRVIMENIGGDAPFGGAYGGDLDPDADLFPSRQTNRVMAFDVVLPMDTSVPDAWSAANFADGNRNPSRIDDGISRTVRKVALFEGTDEFGRLQPLLGTVDGSGTSHAATWFEPTTETPALGTSEDWEIHNFTGDAHPIHLHLVNFETTGRHELTWTGETMVPTTQHNGDSGMVASHTGVTKGAAITTIGPDQGYVETTRKDMVTALPEQVTTIRVSPFDKQGRYVWHCHILSHEDHEMMRVLEVV